MYLLENLLGLKLEMITGRFMIKLSIVMTQDPNDS